MPAMPPKDPLDEEVPSSIRLSRRLWEHLDRIAKDEDRTRNEVIRFFLNWAVEDWERVRAERKARR